MQTSWSHSLETTLRTDPIVSCLTMCADRPNIQLCHPCTHTCSIHDRVGKVRDGIAKTLKSSNARLHNLTEFKLRALASLSDGGITLHEIEISLGEIDPSRRMYVHDFCVTTLGIYVQSSRRSS